MTYTVPLIIDEWLDYIKNTAQNALNIGNRRYHSTTMAAIRRVISEEDLVQDCFCAFLENSAKFDPSRGAKPEAFMHSIFRNTIVDSFEAAASSLHTTDLSSLKRYPNSKSIPDYHRAMDVKDLPDPNLLDGGGMPGPDGKEVEAVIAEADHVDVCMTRLRNEIDPESVDVMLRLADGESQASVAEDCGVCERTISRMNKAALKKSREILKDLIDEDCK